MTGASSGIGEVIAGELAARGHGVTLVARRTDRLEVLAAELASRYRVRAEFVAADLADEGERAAIAAALERWELSVDILVNNAGSTTIGPVYRSTIEGELNMVRTNVEAVVDLCTRFVPAMVERRRGAVLNVASTAAFQPLPGQAGYAATKAFVLSYSEALRGEVRGHGVTVTALCPGPVATGFAEAAGLSDADAAASLPKPMWVPVESVGRAAVVGLDTSRAVVIPGALNRWAAFGARFAPHQPLVSALAKRHPALRDT